MQIVIGLKKGLEQKFKKNKTKKKIKKKKALIQLKKLKINKFTFNLTSTYLYLLKVMKKRNIKNQKPKKRRLKNRKKKELRRR